MVIYDELYNLAVNGKLFLPYDDLLFHEMSNLQRKYTGEQGYKVFPNKDGDVNTDDLVDALAGACYGAINTLANKLPKGQLVSMGTSQQANNIVWRSMQGTPYGVGSGQEVARNMENRSRIPGK